MARTPHTKDHYENMRRYRQELAEGGDAAVLFDIRQPEVRLMWFAYKHNEVDNAASKGTLAGYIEAIWTCLGINVRIPFDEVAPPIKLNKKQEDVLRRSAQVEKLGMHVLFKSAKDFDRADELTKLELMTKAEGGTFDVTDAGRAYLARVDAVADE